jgi:predicted transcriptional regulator
MHAFDVLGDPVRRRILELLVDDEHSSEEVASVICDEFGISQPAVAAVHDTARLTGQSRVPVAASRR